MATLRVRDAYSNEFEIDASARPFWENREGYELLDPIDEPGDEPVPEASGQAEPQAGIQQPDETGDLKTTTRKAAIRAAQDVKEQPGG